MKKFLHFNIYKSIPKGVLNQVVDEKKTIEQFQHQIQWDIKIFSHDDADYPFHENVSSMCKNAFTKEVINYILLRRKAYGWLANSASKYDAVLLRYRTGDIFQYIYAKYFGRYFTIHHTMEVPESKTRKFPIGIIEAAIESFTGAKVLNGATGIIGMTPEIVQYELSRIPHSKPSFCHPNGIDLQHYRAVSDGRVKNGVPTFLLVASNQDPWHGIDLLLSELSRTEERFELHVIGNISASSEHRDDRIIFHGVRDKRYIEEIASKSDIGLSSFALFRKNMSEACPLKVRQYLAMGIPVYSGHVDSGLPPDFPYYKNGGLNLNALFDFAKYSRRFYREEVRLASSKYIDKKLLMKKLISWVESVS